MDLTVLEIGVAALTFFVAQTVKGVTGFGAGLVTLPVLMALLPPDEAILLLVSVDLVTGAWLVKDVFPRIARRLVAVMIGFTVIGQLLGTMILFSIDARMTAQLLGVVVLLMGARFTWRPVVEGRGEIPHLPTQHRGLLGQSALAGFCSGLMRGTVGAGGPPLVVFMRYHFVDGFARAQLLAILFVSELALAGMLLAHGTEPGVFRLTPLVLLPGLAGSRFGAWLAGRASRVAFGRATGLILVLAGIALVLE